MNHDPLKPYPDPPGAIQEPWPPERLEWWAKSQAFGIQYYALGKPVFCPERNWDG